MRKILLVWISMLCSLSGCELIFGITDTSYVDPSGPSGDGSPGDGAIGSCESWQPSHFAPCDIRLPTRPVEIGAGKWLYDTDTGVLVDVESMSMETLDYEVLSQADGSEAHLLSVERFSLVAGSSLRVVGSRPLIVASWSDIHIAGELDVSSSFEDPVAGAGANPASCAAHLPSQGGTEGADAGGGGGGGFGEAGGKGGNGGEDPGDSGGLAGSAVPATLVVRGGCAGALGGQSSLGGGPGFPGPGGGAVQLTAHGRIAIGGIVHAGGGGGGPGRAKYAGGGGGGSGGYIGLDAPEVRFEADAVIAANGGGGGCGRNDSGALGPPGTDGLPADEPAPGGPITGAGPGGAGGYSDGAVGQPGAGSFRGGGGGGGGVGYLITFSAALDDGGAVVSPDPNRF